ncbi:MAG: energy transducer TonB [Bacteroidales bacterium]
MKKENPNLTVSRTCYYRAFLVSVVFVLAFAWSLADSSAFCQTGAIPQKMDSIYQKVDKMPLFNGKDAGTFSEWAAKQIKYPEEAVKNKITGVVMTKFIVEKDGSVSRIVILKSVDPSLDNEAIRVIKSSPKWTPGMKNNVPVRVSIILPVEYKASFPSDTKLKTKQ